MNRRVQVLAEIAERYHELVDPEHSRSESSDGDGVQLMPRTYTATVKEFERLMCVMRNQAKQQAYRGYSLGRLRWHVNAWFIDAQPVVRQVPVLVKQHGKLRQQKNADGTVATRPLRVYRRDKDAREERALLGLEWIAEHWGLQSEPMLPSLKCEHCGKTHPLDMVAACPYRQAA